MNSFVVLALLVAAAYAAQAPYPVKDGGDATIGDKSLAEKNSGITWEKDGKKFTYNKCDGGKPANCEKWVDAAGKVAKGPKVTFNKAEATIHKISKDFVGSYGFTGSVNIYGVFLRKD